MIDKENLIEALPDIYEFVIRKTNNGYEMIAVMYKHPTLFIDEAKTKEELEERWEDILVMHKLM